MLLANPVIPILDKRKVMAATDRARSSWLTYAPCLDHFRDVLGRSQGVAPEQVPSDMITMNSRVALHMTDTDERICVALAYPEHESPSSGRISVLSPMGMSLLGARVGQTVYWQTDDGVRTGVVERLIYQPEAAGHRA